MEVVDLPKPKKETTYIDERGFERSIRDGRPKIYSEDGSKSKYYSRTTSFISVIDDDKKLVDWKLRRALEGASLKPEIIEEFKLIEDHNSPEGKAAGDKIVSWAMSEAKTDWKARLGDALHKLTEEIDRGEDPFIPPDFEQSIEAYVEATKDLEVLDIETFVVCDELCVGGTFDRLYRVHGSMAEKLSLEPGTPVVGDVKTKGEVSYASGEIARQMGIYAHGKRYDPKTYKRSPVIDELNLDVGLIIWMPSTPKPDDPLCAIVPSNIGAGWKSVQVARQVRQERNFWARKAQRPEPVLAIGKGSDLS